MAAFSLFGGTNMAVVTSCENRENSERIVFSFGLRIDSRTKIVLTLLLSGKLSRGAYHFVRTS